MERLLSCRKQISAGGFAADLVVFAGSGFVSVATALLAKRPGTGLGVSATTAALGLPG